MTDRLYSGIDADVCLYCRHLVFESYTDDDMMGCRAITNESGRFAQLHYFSEETIREAGQYHGIDLRNMTIRSELFQPSGLPADHMIHQELIRRNSHTAGVPTNPDITAAGDDLVRLAQSYLQRPYASWFTTNDRLL